jgi:alpha-N-arabinofuranosidase
MTTALMLEDSKDLEAGLVVFQNEKFYYKLVVIEASGKYYLSVSSGLDEILKKELVQYKAGSPVYLKMISLGSEFKCEYSLDNVSWMPFGETLDGKVLSTKTAGGFVGAYFGLYAFADSSAKATFDWATYRKIVK